MDGPPLAQGSFGTTVQRLLVVDDEKVIAETVALIARHNGYEAFAACSGQEALQALERFRPDILLTDYSMPGMNGYALMEAVATELPGCRLFLLTAFSDLPKLPDDSRLPVFRLLNKPLHPNDLLAALAEPSAEIIPASPTILYVDDVEPHRYSIRRLLSRHGFLVIEASNGDDALQKFAAKPDLVLLDINLPDFNGFEVCRRLRMVDKKHVPIVHLTSNYRNGEGKRQSQASGADEYIEQPIEANALTGRLRQILQGCYLKES